jgi:hypothetical protein
MRSHADNGDVGFSKTVIFQRWGHSLNQTAQKQKTNLTATMGEIMSNPKR